VKDIATARVTVLEYAKAKGLSKEKQKDSDRCFNIPSGTEFTNSGVGTDGQLFTFEDTAEAGGERACTDNGVTRLVECGNKVWLHHQPQPDIKEGRVKLVHKFSKVKVALKAKASAAAHAECPDGSATADGYGEASAKVRIRLKELVKTKGDSAVRLYDKVFARAKAKASADAYVECNTTPPPPPPPPPENLPPTVVTDNPNHVGKDDEIVFCATASDQDGYIVSYNFDANRGFFVEDSRQDGNDPGEICETYHAPSAANQDVTLSVQVADNEGKTAEDSTTFPIVDIPK
jgi:hypothetical protein